MTTETPNHPNAVCSLHGLPCHELGEVLIERDALRSRLSAIDTAKAGKPPIPVWHEHDRYNYAEPEHRFRARLEDWGREGWDAAAALRVELSDLRAAASAAVLAYGAHAHAQLRELFDESRADATLKALDMLAEAMSNLDIALQAAPVAPQGEVQP